MNGAQDDLTFEEVRMRRERAKNEGKIAFNAGETKNPYPSDLGSGAERIAWWDGWLDQRTISRLGHIFKKYDLSYPPTPEEMADRKWQKKKKKPKKKKKKKI